MQEKSFNWVKNIQSILLPLSVIFGSSLVCLFSSIWYDICTIIKLPIFKPLWQAVSYTRKNEKKTGRNGLKGER